MSGRHCKTGLNTQSICKGGIEKAPENSLLPLQTHLRFPSKIFLFPSHVTITANEL